MLRRSNTALEIVALGEFAKLGRKHYAHGTSGAEIKWDCNRWSWVVSTDGSAFGVLHAAVSWVRHLHPAAVAAE